MKKLLLLGGTQISCEIVRQAQEMGLFVGVADYNSVENSPGKQIADAAYDMSCTNVGAIVKLIEEYNYDGVITGFNDMLLPYYADICKNSGKPCYGTKDQFELFTNKRAYKKLLKDFDIPVVDDYTDEVKTGKLENLVYPIVVKPSDNSGSRGVKVCKNRDEFDVAYQNAIQKSTQGEVIVERYMDGKEATVFWFFVNGEYYLTGVGNRHCNGFQEGCIPLPVGYTFPSILTDKYIKEVVPKVKEMLKSIGIQNGMMFMQCKVEDGNCYVYDIGYRLTGSLEYKLIEKCCGYNPLRGMIEFAVGENNQFERIQIRSGRIEKKLRVDPFFCGLYPYNVSILSKLGIIKKIDGIDEVRAMTGVIDVVVEHGEGDEITADMRGLLSQISVRVLGYARNRTDMIPTMRKIEKMIKVVSQNDEELSFGEMNEADLQMVAG